MKRGRGFAVHPKQRKAVRGKPCVGCGLMSGLNADGTVASAVDPAHLWPRGKGGCDEERCVVPLCRSCHRRLDDPSDRFDLLPRLIDGGYYPEMAHAIEAHKLSPLTLLERLTGSEWTETARHNGRRGAG